MKEPLFCKGCKHSKVYKHSGWECQRKEDEERCIDGSEYVSIGDVLLRRNPEERKEEL